MLTPLLVEHRNYERGSAYRFDLDIGEWNGRIAKCQVIAEQLNAPPDDWPLRAGDVIQNFRAALDHAVWGAWRSDSANTGGGRHTQFPVATKRKSFREQARRCLDGVPAAARKSVESAQPFNVAADQPEMDGLAVLARLSNIDKHRTLTAVSVAVAPAALGHSDDIAIESWDHGTRHKLTSERSVVASFVARSDRAPAAHDLQPMYGYEVHLEDYPFGILGYFVRRVHETLWCLETGKSREPWMPYPVWIGDQFEWANA